MVASQKLIQRIQYFKVAEFNIFSDHCPITCSISYNKRIMTNTEIPVFQDKPLGYRWKSDSTNTSKCASTLTSSFMFKNAQTSESVLKLIGDINTDSASCATIDDINNVNAMLIKTFTEIADSSLEKKRQPAKFRNKNVWYDKDCRNEKRNLSRLTKQLDGEPKNEGSRSLFHASKRNYNRLIRRKKRNFLHDLNVSIEEGNNINWRRFKSLRSTQQETDRLDLHDLAEFCKFYKELFSNKSLSEQRINKINAETAKLQFEDINADNPGYSILNDNIEMDELDATISKLKSGKAASEDNILNEFLKNCGENLRTAILNVFNTCLDNGVYPWNSSVVTLLHKKGDRTDPNNYRAIAIGSNIGNYFQEYF